MLLSAANLFQPAVPYTVGYQPCAVAVGDFNHDGIPDLVTVAGTSTSDPGTMSILLGTGDGTFGTATNIDTNISPAAVVVGRFNNDAFDDIAVADYDSNGGGSVATVDIFLGNGDGTFQDKTSYATPSSPVFMALADFNGDGYDDLAVSSEEGDNDQNLAIFLADSDGSGGFSLNDTYASYWVEGITAGKFDADNNVDLAVVNQQDSSHVTTYSVTIFTGQGDGTFQVGNNYALDDGATGITSVDLNGDGHLDLAVTCGGSQQFGLGILMGVGNGTFGEVTNFNAIGNPVGVAAGDLDNDGLMDLAIAESGDSAIRVKLGDGAGGFRNISDEEVDAGAGPTGVVVADFNGDGRLDVATTDQQGSEVSVLLGTGPSASDMGFMMNRNATKPLTRGNFIGAFSDPNDLSLQQITIGSLPEHGTLKYRGRAVTVGQVISARTLSSLTFTFARYYDGSDSFQWRGSDGTASSNLATVTFITRPDVTIAAGDNAFEGGAASDFTISLNHASLVDLRINLSAASRGAAGRNYVRLPRYVTILAGEMSAEVALTPLVDGVAKGDIAVKEKVVGGRGYTIGTARSGVVTIVDDEPKISFTATNASTQLGGTAGQITIASSGLFGSDLILTLVIRGSARNGRDYLLLSKTVTIPAGSSSTAIDIVPLLNPARAKTVTLSCKVNNLIFSLSPLAKSALVSILHV